MDKLADAISKAPIDELEKIALEKLRGAIKNKKDGKPHTPIYVISRDESGKLLSDGADSVL